MIDLDKYINDGVQVKLKGKEVTVKQPTAKLAKEISKLEAETNEDNRYEIRAKITLKLLNNNTEGIKFTDADIEDIPVKLQIEINNEVFRYIYKLENSPN